MVEDQGLPASPSWIGAHDLLDFTRTRLGGGVPLSVAPLDLVTLCQEVLGEFRTAYPARRLHFESVGDLRGQWDAARLRQVLSNLVGNAIEHGAERSPIEVVAKSEESKVLLTVTNQGPVIASSALPNITRQIVIAHAGTITVASSEEAGTVFTVCLPRQNENA